MLWKWPRPIVTCCLAVSTELTGHDESYIMHPALAGGSQQWARHQAAGVLATYLKEVSMYGWRGSIGVIVPSSDRTTEMDFHALCPEGVAIYGSRMPLFETNDPKEKFEALRLMDVAIPSAAKLVADTEPDLIAFCCTTGSFLKGPGTDEKIISIIKEETGIDAITTSTALVEAIRHLGVTQIDLLTPYNPEIGSLAADFLVKSIDSLTINNHRDLGIVSGLEKCKVSPFQVYKNAKDIASDKSDALVISCTALQCVPIIDALERDIGKPVITSNFATVWLALKKLGIKEGLKEKGQLLAGLSQE